MQTEPIAKRLDALRLRRVNHNKTKTIVARPVASLRFFIPLTADFGDNGWLSWDETPEVMCDAIAAYLQVLDSNLHDIRWTHWVGSAMKDVTRGRLETILRSRPNSVEWCGINTLNSEPSDIGAYGVSASFSSSTRIISTFPKRVANLRLDFPTTTDNDVLAALFQTLAGIIPMQFAHAGYSFKEEPARLRGRTQIAAKLAQYPGIAPGVPSIADDMLNHTYAADWKVAISDELVSHLLEEANGWPCFEHTLVEKVDDSWVFTTASRPLAGGKVKGHREFGGRPELAAFLRPLRLPLKKEGWLSAWLSQFDGEGS